MKTLIYPLTVLVACSLLLNVQDMYPVRQLSFELAQEGFATWSPDGRLIVFDADTGNSIKMIAAACCYTRRP